MRRPAQMITPVVIFLLLLSGGNAAAIPTFGTLMPERGKYQAGGRANFIFEREVKDYDSGKMSSYSYQMSYGLSEWFCLDGLIGWGIVRAGHINEKELRYPVNFNGGYGWRAKLYKNEEQNIDWVFGFQHVSAHPNNQIYNGIKHEMIWDEWQLSTVLSKELRNLRPYCGMKWSFTYFISKQGHDRHRRLSNGYPIGLVVGTDLRMNNYIYINAEGRFFDETALNAGFTIRY